MIIKLRIRKKNLAAFEEGVNVEHIWLEQGEDGVYALCVVTDEPLPVDGVPPRG